MHRQFLIEALTPAVGKKTIVKLRRAFRKSGRPLAELVSLSFFDDDARIAARAAWLLEHVFIGKMAHYAEEVSGLINAFPHVRNSGCRRHYAKMMVKITDPRSGAMQKVISEKNLEPVIETAFDWLIDDDEKVAVKVFCAQILFQLSARHGWIREELIQQLHFLMRDGSAGMQSRGRKILSALKD